MGGVERGEGGFVDGESGWDVVGLLAMGGWLYGEKMGLRAG
jgi:hypothetical protein